ncbi:type II toxin-antitoxin system antitoxin DNA ADP-ribosyl glycohydrolase DarG [Paracoccus fontiphilus]|uniref:Macro domain-containing protein n=1 Tax=Paracoccus fontiphilus TaxID=1815556 RepID=A0ABV7IIQ4_9RHOB|nr:macro domain-containing protein [Paracoccus fontiphilus]
MTVKFKNGDMFAEPVEALVNTVNCVGVMGKGVAHEFKVRWPDNYKEYKTLCARKGLRPGQMFTFQNMHMFGSTGPRYLVNFPTKDHWKAKSKISYVEDGLDALATEIERLGIKSIAMPPLGCGNGGLDWSEVKPLIMQKLGHLNDVDVVVFEPLNAAEAPEFTEATLNMTTGRAILLKALGDLEKYFDGAFDRVSLQKIAYFIQALGVNLKLDFSRNLHGPYSETLRKSYISLEKHGMIKGFVEGDRLSKVTPTGYAIADEYLTHHPEVDIKIIERLDHLIQGYESPYGLELLSSVHWLANHEKHSPIEKIISEMATWNENKRNLFQENAIREAYKRLEEDGLLN